jgi:hypothetical protein
MPADREEAREMALECIGRAESLTSVLVAYTWGGDARSWDDVQSVLEVLDDLLYIPFALVNEWWPDEETLMEQGWTPPAAKEGSR